MFFAKYKVKSKKTSWIIVNLVSIASNRLSSFHVGLACFAGQMSDQEPAAKIKNLAAVGIKYVLRCSI